MVWLKGLLFCVFIEFSLQIPSHSLKVKLDHGGILVGRHSTTINGRHIRAFKGIPYAKAPVGDLRFKAPVEHPAWEGEKQVIETPPRCMQIDPFIRSTQIVGEEDCLFLNVYTPPLDEIKEALPVMVWFHGGGFHAGSGSDEMYGPKYLLDKNVILVSANYRVGILGFLSTESLDCPGNFGLKDQLETLKWVNKNIKSFGGDPNSVTVFGQSAGAASVGYHIFSEKSNKLFHKVILQSGNNFNPWAFQLKEGRAAAKARKIGEFAGCKGNMEKLIQCLRNLPAEKVIERFYDFFEWDIHPTIPFAPVIEPDHPEAFITADPRKYELKSQNKPLMIGITSREGLIFSAPFIASTKLSNDIKTDYKRLFPLIFHYDHLSESKQERLTKEINEFYFKDGYNFSPNNHENLTNLVSDTLFGVGFEKFLERRLERSTAPTYVYIFDYLGSISMPGILGDADFKVGVCHGDDLQYLFSWEELLKTVIPSKTDILVREALVDLWVNFAIHGNPTPANSKLPKWQPTTQFSQYNFARIGCNEDSVTITNEDNFAPTRMAFWRKWNPYFLEYKDYLDRDEL